MMENSESKSRKLVGSSRNSVLGMSAKMTEKSAESIAPVGSSSSYAVIMQEYNFISEFNLLKHHVEPGVYVIPAAKTPFIWYGVIFARAGPYFGGVFRFRIDFPRTFPECTEWPTVMFETPLFHPFVAADGQLRLDAIFERWRSPDHHLWQLVEYVSRTINRPRTMDIRYAVNAEAAELYETDCNAFNERAAECAESSKTAIYDKANANDDPHYFQFDPYNPELHEPYRNMLLAKQKHPLSDNVAYGRNNEVEELRSISWVQPGSLEPLSKPNN